MGGKYGKHVVEDVCTNKHQEYLESLYEKLCDDGIISLALFQDHFFGPSPRLINNLFDRFFIDLVNESSETKSLFIDRCKHILENIDIACPQQARFLFDLVNPSTSDLTLDNIKTVIHTFCKFGVYQSSLLHGDFVSSPSFEIGDTLISSIALSLLGDKKIAHSEEMMEWILLNHPMMLAGVTSWLFYKFAGISEKESSTMLPQPRECTSSNLLLTPSCLWFLCCTLPSCYTYMENKYKVDEEEESQADENTLFTWNLLYNSNQNGLSLNRFKHKVMEYKSPTVTLIELSSGLLMALVVDEKWIDSPEKFGGPYCQLLELSPTVTVVEASSKMVYLKERGRTVPTGLLIGSCTKPLLKISTDLNTAEVYYKNLLGEPVERIEVWGCGGVDALKNQKDVKKWEQKETEKRKKVKLPGQWDADKTILEMGGVRCNHSERGDI